MSYSDEFINVNKTYVTLYKGEVMDNEQNIYAILTGYYDKLNAHALADMLRYFSDDATIDSVSLGKKNLTPVEYLEKIKPIIKDLKEARFDIKSMLFDATQSQAVVVGTQTITSKKKENSWHMGYRWHLNKTNGTWIITKTDWYHLPKT